MRYTNGLMHSECGHAPRLTNDKRRVHYEALEHSSASNERVAPFFRRLDDHRRG